MNRSLAIARSSDAETLDEFDTRVALASRGDARAVGCIAIALSPTLLGEIRRVVGRSSSPALEADVLQDLFLSMLESRRPFVPGPERGLEWLRCQARSIAAAFEAQLDGDDRIGPQ